MKKVEWRSRDGRHALNIIANGIVALFVIPLLSLTPFNFGLQLLSFVVFMTASAAIVWLAVDHNFPVVDAPATLSDEWVNTPSVSPLPPESIPPLPTQRPSISITQAMSLQEYRELRHWKRLCKEAYGAILGLECLLLGLVTVLLFQARGGQGIASMNGLDWRLIAGFYAVWVCYGWLAFENTLRKRIIPSDGVHPPHYFGRLQSSSSYLVSIAWVIWASNSSNGPSVISILIGVAGVVVVLTSCFTIYREYWWHRRHWLIVSGYRVYISYPKNKWLWFKGGEPEINVWQVNNCIDQGQTWLELWLFKDSTNVLINGPGEDDKVYFANMSDVLHHIKLKAAIDNNREMYYKRYGASNLSE